MKRTRRNPWRPWLWLLCYLGAFHPNCGRCCPDGYGCSCKWSWEDCPPNNGCSACSSTSGGGDAGFSIDASTKAEPIEPVPGDVPGGTIAFVPSPTGAFVVASIPSMDVAHVVHLEATTLDEDPLTLRTIGDVPLDAEPGRTIADGARARIVLRRGGAIATLDPATLAIDRTRVCASPHGLALGNDLLHVGCASGELVTLTAATSQEVKHRFLDGDLEDVALFGDSIVASTPTHLVVVEPDGSVTERDGNGSHRHATAFVSLAALGSMPIADLDVASDGALVLVSNGEAYVQPSGAMDLAPVGAPGIARAAAIGAVTTEGVRRRLVAVQTDALLVFYSLSRVPDAMAIEPLR